MKIENYCIIDANNVVVNIILWDGDKKKWKPASKHTYVVQSKTPSKDWVWDNDLKDWILVEAIGHGDIGFTWDKSTLTTPEPKPVPLPVPEQPTVEGAQTL